MTMQPHPLLNNTKTSPVTSRHYRAMQRIEQRLAAKRQQWVVLQGFGLIPNTFVAHWYRSLNEQLEDPYESCVDFSDSGLDDKYADDDDALQREVFKRRTKREYALLKREYNLTYREYYGLWLVRLMYFENESVVRAQFGLTQDEVDATRETM